MIAKLAFIAAQIGHHAIRLLCRVLGVSRSWFHAWRRTAPERAARAVRHKALIAQIKSIFDESKRRMPVATDSRHGYGVAPNLLDRNFKITAPDMVWLADISSRPMRAGSTSQP